MTWTKINSAPSMTRKYEHNYRTEKVPNANPELLHQNEELVHLTDGQGNPCNYLDAYKDKIRSLEYYQTHAVRSNGVRALEILTTFSREDKDHIDIEKWKEDNVKWLEQNFNRDREKYGNNVASVIYHADEPGNVHCHAFVIPIDERGRLNASAYIGTREKARQLQDSYAKAMEPHGLKRGLKGSSARHQDIKKFYAELNQRMVVPSPQKGESVQEYHERITSFVQEERAAGLRELKQKESDMQHRMDEERQRNIKMAVGEAHAERAAMRSELQDLQDAISKKQEELEKMDAEYARIQTEYAKAADKARKLIRHTESIENAAEKIAAYDRFQEAFYYAQEHAPELAEDFSKDMDAIEQVFWERELPIDH